MTDETFWDKLEEIRASYQEGARKYEKEADDFWENLPYEQKLLAFYSVCKRIHRGDLVDKGSYRYVLYDVFGFGPDAYAIGMECDYMTIHNSFVE